jgi:transposase-like protein
MSTIPMLKKKELQLNSRDFKEIESHCQNTLIDQQTETRLILDLLAKNNSPNDIKDHLWNVFKLRRKYHAIRKVVLRNAKRAQRINNIFDLWACQTVMLIEIDETFKGRKVSLLVVADSLTGYIFMIIWLPKRSESALIAALTPLKDLFWNVKLVLTDGAPYFPKVVKEICPNAKLQRCLIHILRNLYPHILPQRQAYYGALKKVQKTRVIYLESLANHEQRLKKLNALKKQLKYWKDKRLMTQARLGVKKYQKNINRDYPELKTIYDRINIIQAQVRSMKTTAIHDREHLPLLKEDIAQAERWKNHAWGLYMKFLHILYDFYNLFRRSPKKFHAEREKYITKLVDNPATDLTKAILTVLTEVKEISTIYQEDCPVRLSRNYINTNVIESINSRLRPILDKLKKLQDTPYLKSVLEIVRLRLNASRPYSGSRSKQSPIERCGYDLKSRTWIDLILNGLPPGSQPQKTLLSKNDIFKQTSPFLKAKMNPILFKDDI